MEDKEKLKGENASFKGKKRSINTCSAMSMMNKHSGSTGSISNGNLIPRLTIELDKLQRQITGIQSMLMSTMGYQTVPVQRTLSNRYVALRGNQSLHHSSQHPSQHPSQSRSYVRDGTQSRTENRPVAEQPIEKQETQETQEKHSLNPNAPEWKPTVEKKNTKTIPLSDLLQEGEEVILRVITGKSPKDNYPVFTTAITRYEKGRFTVIACETIESLVGQSSDKPGTLVYQFIAELIKVGILRRHFSMAPWKLCFVKRNGQHQSIYQLYQDALSSSSA